MKKVSIVLAAIMFCALVPYGNSQAKTVTANVVSEPGVLVDGPSETDFLGVPTADADPSIALSPVDPSWPQAPAEPLLTGAAWITTATQPDNATRTTYRLFEDSFVPACTATNLVGSLHTAANNVQDIYFNGVLLGTGTDSDTNLGVPKLDTFAFTPEQDPANIPKANAFGFDVLTRGGPEGTTTPNPAGVIYNAVISYNLPDVIWRPPIVGTGRSILKDGTTLPIKFRLRSAAGIIRTPLNIYLSITGPGVPGVEVARFDRGRGSRGLRFARGNGQYIANFHSKRYDLVTGAVYMVNVNDGCTGEILGSIPMTISGKGGYKRGNGNGHGNGHGHGKK